MIIDCVMASYEEDALRVRDEELKDVVDLRVIVQGMETFRGQPLDLHCEVGHTDTVFHRFDFGPEKDPWRREHALREFSLNMGYQENDQAWLLLSDADEIPHPDAIREAAHQRGPALLPVDMREWFMDWRAPDEWQPPHQPLIGRYADYQRAGGAQAARTAFGWLRTGPRGWHLSTLGDGALAAAKLSAFAHSEYDTPAHNDADVLEQRRVDGRDILDRFNLEGTADVPGCANLFPHLRAFKEWFPDPNPSVPGIDLSTISPLSLCEKHDDAP